MRYSNLDDTDHYYKSWDKNNLIDQEWLLIWFERWCLRLVAAITELTVDISRLHIFNKNNNNLSFNIQSITIIQIIVYNYNRNLLKKIVCSICLSLTFCHLCITILLIIMIIIKYNIYYSKN